MSDEIRCPKCKSTQLHAGKRGWNMMTGLIGSSTVMITCLSCGKKFKPGEGAKSDAAPKTWYAP
jgi:ribosomal protein S27E